MTAEGVPVPAPYALSDVLATNLFRNADARTIDGFAAFWGTGGNGTTVSVAAPWAESGRAVRFTQTVTASNNPHFDLRPGHWMEAGKRYTMVWDVVGPGTYSSTGGLGGYPTVGLVAQSPLRTEVVGSTPRRMWATVDVPAGGLPGGWQVYLSLPTSAGQWVEFGNAHMYEGDYDPSREWFSGSGSATPGAQTAWTGTPDASPAVLYR